MTRIELMSPASAAGPAPITAPIAALVNAVYEVAEQGLWRPGATRTSPAEVAESIRAGELVAAYRDGRLTGVVRLRRWSTDGSEFGMLAVDPAARGLGIGRELVSWCEDTARARGHRFMRLELLVPRTFELASKQRLATWYDRLGYRLEHVGRIEEQFPHLAPLLAVDADFRVYRKAL